jgi:hypothetical protein
MNSCYKKKSKVNCDVNKRGNVVNGLIVYCEFSTKHCCTNLRTTVSCLSRHISHIIVGETDTKKENVFKDK